jgi:hypothetical protein
MVLTKRAKLSSTLGLGLGHYINRDLVIRKENKTKEKRREENCPDLDDLAVQPSTALFKRSLDSIYTRYSPHFSPHFPTTN